MPCQLVGTGPVEQLNVKSDMVFDVLRSFQNEDVSESPNINSYYIEVSMAAIET